MNSHLIFKVNTQNDPLKIDKMFKVHESFEISLMNTETNDMHFNLFQIFIYSYDKIGVTPISNQPT